jgi:hypothetical protein
MYKIKSAFYMSRACFPRKEPDIRVVLHMLYGGVFLSGEKNLSTLGKAE